MNFLKKFDKKQDTKSRLVSMTEMVQKAHAGHYAVAQININNLE
jgi:hypothetical protein